jgi:hypothetical protein
MPARIDEKLDRIIKIRFTASFMSNAKWRKFFIVIDKPELNLKQAIWKFIDSEHEIRGWLPKSDELMERYVGDYGLGPFAYKHIEWLEIPETGIPLGFEKVPFKYWHQNINEVISTLNSVGQFEIQRTERGVRIYGFK